MKRVCLALLLPLASLAWGQEPRPAATIAGEPIPLQRVDEAIRPQLMELRAREHQLRRQALAELVADELIRREADARGISDTALEKAEVLDKAVVSDAEARAAAPPAAGAAPDARALESVKARLASQRQRERRAAFVRELQAKYGVEILLEPYRVPVEVGDAPVRGNPKAPVTIIEFSDFQCPFCVRARETARRVLATYGDGVRWVFRHFPLGFHEQAQKAGEAVACAGDQGRFWEMHDRLWAANGKLDVGALKAAAAEIGLDGVRFAQCLDGGARAEVVKADLEAGLRSGVSGTPAFFINGRPLVGAQPFEVFKDAIDDELRRAGK